MPQVSEFSWSKMMIFFLVLLYFLCAKYFFLFNLGVLLNFHKASKFSNFLLI